MAAAIAEGLKTFSGAGAVKRHIIALTDGITEEAAFPQLLPQLREEGVSVSTIAIGDATNDELLMTIADESGGRFYRAIGDEIPQVIDEETIRMTRELIQEGRIAARVVSETAMVEGLGPALPALSGYLLTTAKELAVVEIEAKDEAADSGTLWDPLLASWRYGNGKVAVFTSDSGGRWLSAWAELPLYKRLWAQTVRSIQRAEPDSGLRCEAVAEAGGARIIVDALGADRRFLSALRLNGSVQGQGGAFAFEETAPGRYEAFAPIEGSGLFGIDVADENSRLRGFAWVWKDALAEASHLGPDRSALALIASETGGSLSSLDQLDPPPPARVWTAVPISSPLLVLAALLLLADLFLRSTMAGQLDRAVLAASLWWKKQRSAASAPLKPAFYPVESLTEAEREARFIELQKKLAERLSRRDAEKNGGEDDKAT